MSYINFLDIDNIGVGNTFLHKLNPLTKFLFLIVIYITMFSFGIRVQEIFILLIIILLHYTNLKFSALSKVLMMTLFVVLSFEVLIFLLNVNNKLYITFTIFIRILSMVLPLVLYSNITPLKETMYTITKIINPLGYINIAFANLLGLCLTLIITYIPLLFFEFDRVFLIKASKDDDIKNSSITKKINIIYTSLFPVLVNSFMRADQMVDSIVIRRFNKDIKRSNYIVYEVNVLNKILIIVGLLYIILSMVFSIMN